VLLAAARPARCAASSGLALLGQVAGGLALRSTLGVTGAGLLLCWAAGAALAIGCVPAPDQQVGRGTGAAGRRRRAGGSIRWLGEGRAYWPRFLCQDMTLGGASQVGVLLVAGIAGAVVVAGLRAATLLLAPVLVLQQTTGYFALAEATRVAPARRVRFLFFCQGGAILAGGGWLVVLEVLPRSVLGLVVGDNLAAGLAALPGMALFVVGSVLVAVPGAVLRTSGHVRAGMNIGLALAPVLVGVPAVLAGWGGGAAEVAAGFGLYGLLSALVWTLATVRILGAAAPPSGAAPGPAEADRTGPLAGGHRAR
jgi:hypothetical protein